MESFQIRTTIPGHEKDVRCLQSYPNDCEFLSGSRDVTVRSWLPDGKEFRQKYLLDGHSNFISSVEIAIPYRGSEQGVIFTGSNDTTIRAYGCQDGKYIFTLKAHGETVCSLKYNDFVGLLLSGSWDKTARLWKDDQCISTLSGHEAAVWSAVFLPKGDGILTGSADKSIRLWRPLSFNQAKWTCQERYLGHSDCVRGLTILNDDMFLSCGNDASIRLWKLSGECAMEFYGHTNFIYDICVLPNGNEFVSSSEDRSVRVWNVHTGETIQTITMPCQSVWCVAALSNGDIAVGGNDAMIRVFTRNPDLQAPEEERILFSEQVSSTAIPGQLGDIKLNEVPGPEVLSRPGRSEGFVTMVKRGTAVECYQWSQGQWSKIGDVVGSSGATQQSSGKQLYEGREYDYVFTVDVVEGAPPIKLPYNITEDPFVAAQAFIHRHNLPQQYLDEVANFITKNVQGVTLQQTTSSASTYMDPFTGGGRYIPGTGAEMGGGMGSDPLTGTGRYIPPSDGATAVVASNYETPSSVVRNSFFPVNDVVTFDTANIEGVLKKIKEFNVDATEKLTVEVLENIPSICDKNYQKDPKALDVVIKVMSAWAPEKVFPLLDVIRLAIRSARIQDHVFKTPEFLEHTLSMIRDENTSDVNTMLVYRIVCNTCLHPAGQNQILNLASDLLEHLKTKLGSVVKSTNKNLQVAYVSIILNLSILLYRSSSPDLLLTEFLMVLGSQLLSHSTLSPEATFRLLVGMGTLVSQLKGNDRRTLVLSSDLTSVVAKHCSADEKVGLVARDLKKVLS